MIRQKNRFLALLFSLIPGAGQMYLGFQRKGVSIMVCLIVILMASLAFEIAALLLFVALLWFYAFFDTMSLNTMPKEEFAKMKDSIFVTSLFSEWQKSKDGINSFIENGSKTYGFLIVMIGLILGCKSLIKSFLPLFMDVSSPLYIIFVTTVDIMPALLVSLLIIITGFKVFFITGNLRKKEQALELEKQKGLEKEKEIEIKLEPSPHAGAEMEDLPSA